MLFPKEGHCALEEIEYLSSPLALRFLHVNNAELLHVFSVCSYVLNDLNAELLRLCCAGCFEKDR